MFTLWPWLRAAVALLLALSLPAWAADECKEYKLFINDPWVKTPEAACAAQQAQYNGAGACVFPSTGNIAGSLYVQTVECGPENCKSKQGQDIVVNWTVGYSRYPAGHEKAYDTIAPPTQLPKDGAMCMQGCKLAAENVGIAAYRSASPTPQGTYRLSLDVNAQHIGESCIGTDADTPLDPKAPIPPCEGNVGEVNGVTVCTGTAQSPVRNDTPGTEPSGGHEGNPTAGPKPSSGEGSGTGGAGRTPSTGNGGPGGGPAGAAGNGKGPDGKTDKPEEGKEQANCGAPGQPKCKIDETGTPDGKGAFDGINKGAEENQKGFLDEIAKWKDRKADGWTWTFQLPSGCSPVHLAGYELSIDVCQFQPVIHDIMSMVWAIATVMGCAVLVFNASGKN